MLVFSVALVAGFFGTLHPAFDFFAHFRVHLAVLMALCALPLLTTSFRLQAAAALLFAVAAFATTSNALPAAAPVAGAGGVAEARPSDQRGLPPAADEFSLQQSTPEKVLSLIGRTQPDVITLDEMSEMWRQNLACCPAPIPTGSCALSQWRIRRGAALQAALCRRRRAALRPPRRHGHRHGRFRRNRASTSPPSTSAGHGRSSSHGRSANCRNLWPRLARHPSWRETAMPVPWSAAVRRVASLGKLTVMPSAGPTWLRSSCRISCVSPDCRSTRSSARARSSSIRDRAGRHRLGPSSGDGGISLRPEAQKPATSMRPPPPPSRSGKTRG